MSDRFCLMESCSPGKAQVIPLPSRNKIQTYKSSRGRQCKFTDKMEGFIDLKRKKKVDKVPDLPVQLAQPELGHGYESLKETTPNDLSLKSKKTFLTDGPSVPQTSPIYHYEDPFKKLGVKLKEPEDDERLMPWDLSSSYKTKPVEHFVKGSVKYTTQDGLRQMLAEIPSLRGSHGCIVDENYLPDADVYDRDVHYIVDKTLGKGSNGRAELCYDSGSGKPFVRKEISKETLQRSEVLVPLNLNHDNITKFYGLIQREGPMGALRMELLLEFGGTAINNYLLDETLAEDQIWDLTRQGLSALQTLDYFGMVHFDVKPENLCIKWTGSKVTLKMTDFGSAKLPQDPVTFVGWTPEYMAPESCKLVMQTLHGVQFNPMVTQNDMTGKVDVFAFALVVMYMYKRYHILQKVVTEGKTSYRDFSAQQRQALQMQLMLSLATQEDLVHNLVPDECDLDMRELLLKMTQHDIQGRLGAEQALLVVNEREVKKNQLVPILPQQEEPAPAPTRARARVKVKVEEMPDSPPPAVNPTGNNHIPDIAVTQMDVETGPIKNMTKDKLRRKLQKPYVSATGGKDGKSLGKHVASKTMVQTPVEEMEMLTLTHRHESKPSVQVLYQRTEKIGKVVTQPTDDVDFISTEQTPTTAQPESSVSQVTNMDLDQWVNNLTRGGETKRRKPRRVDKTANVPPLVCLQEAEVMDCLEYDVKKGSYRQEGDMMVSLAKANSASSAQRNAAMDFQKLIQLQKLAVLFNSQPQINFGNTNNMTLVTSTNNTAVMDMEPEPAKTEGGNLPNFAFM